MQIRLVMTGLLLLPVTAFAAIEVNASVDANRITPNETITFKIESSGGDDFPAVDISPLLSNFTVVSGPGQQTSFQWINGKMSSTRSLTWTLLPKKTGRLTIPALEIRVGRKLFQNKPSTLRYRWPVSAKVQTTILPLFSGRRASCDAAKAVAPEDIPTNKPSLRAI